MQRKFIFIDWIKFIFIFIKKPNFINWQDFCLHVLVNNKNRNQVHTYDTEWQNYEFPVKRIKVISSLFNKYQFNHVFHQTLPHEHVCRNRRPFEWWPYAAPGLSGSCPFSAVTPGPRGKSPLGHTLLCGQAHQQLIKACQHWWWYSKKEDNILYDKKKKKLDKKSTCNI